MNGDMFSIQQQWEIHFLLAVLAAWPLSRVFRRAGVPAWPVVFVLVPIFGFAIVGSFLAFKRWPLVAPRVPPKPARKATVAKVR